MVETHTRYTRCVLETRQITHFAGHPELGPSVSGEARHLSFSDGITSSLSQCRFKGGTEIRIRNVHRVIRPPRSPDEMLRETQ